MADSIASNFVDLCECRQDDGTPVPGSNPDCPVCGWEEIEDDPREEGDPCSECGEPLELDRREGVLACANDWEHL